MENWDRDPCVYRCGECASARAAADHVQGFDLDATRERSADFTGRPVDRLYGDDTGSRRQPFHTKHLDCANCRRRGATTYARRQRPAPAVVAWREKNGVSFFA